VKTTVDLPEDVLRKAKITAVERKTTLKELICQSLLREIASPSGVGTDATDERKRRSSALLDSLDRIQITSPIGKFDREQAQRHSAVGKD
jgi:hypothetical protein